MPPSSSEPHSSPRRLFEAVTGCYDSGVALSEGEVPFYVLGDGGDEFGLGHGRFQ